MRRRYQPHGVSSPPVAIAVAAPGAFAYRPRVRRRPGRAATALLAPSFVFLFLFTYWPVLRVLGQSLLVGRFAGDYRFGFENYQRLFADGHFARAALNNLAYAAGTIAPGIVLALGLAVALRETTRWNAVLRTLFVMPLLIPLVAAAALFSFILLPGGGLLDFYLGKLGVATINWLGEPDLALGSIVAITIWKNTGYYMLFFIAGLAGVPQDLIDAATIDGAGRWRRFRAVTLPMLGPTFGFVVPIALVNALTQIDHVVTMTQGGPSDATNLLLYYIYQQAAQNDDTGLASAATVISVASLLSLVLSAIHALERRGHYES
jgi:sn-glycerol 3-phosphate transport system permease protein